MTVAAPRARRALLALPLLLAAACATPAPTEPRPAADLPTAPAVAVATSETGGGTPQAAATATETLLEVLPDGRYFVFMKSLDKDTDLWAATFDLAEWFSGEEAKAAALADSAIDEGDDVPNDYYIRNPDPRLRSMRVDGAATAKVVDWLSCCELQDSDLEALSARGFGAAGQDAFWLTVSGGSITALEEQYRP